ncbi:MAG TPA: hypothetical protein VI389_10110, partial [Geobacteraceae bacterium]
QGNASKRQESQPRVRHHRDLLFPLHGQAVCGVADALDIYRKSEQFIGLNSITIHEEPATAAGLSLPEFLRHVDCPPPSFMAVNLKCVIHS